MANLPNNPGGDNNNPSSTPPSDLPPFGSGFNPHANPQDSNSPYQTQPQSNPVPLPSQPFSPNPPSIHEEVAQHRPRDAQGHFLPYEHPTAQPPVANQTVSAPILEPSGPKPNTFSEKIKSTWHFFSKNYKKIGTIAAFIYLVAMNSSFQSFVAQYFPNSSPILSRAVSMQGLLKTSETGIYTLVLPDQSSYILHFKPTAALTNLKKLNEVVVKGNLTWTPYTIENAEIYPLNISTPDMPSEASLSPEVSTKREAKEGESPSPLPVTQPLQSSQPATNSAQVK